MRHGSVRSPLSAAWFPHKRLLAKNNPSNHTPQRPHIQTIVICLQIDQQLRAFEVTARDSHVVLPPRVVELGKSPVDESQLLFGVVDDDVVRLNIAVHHSGRVAEVEGDEQLVDVEAHVAVRERRVEDLEVDIVDVLENEARRLRGGVADDVEEAHYIGSARQIL